MNPRPCFDRRDWVAVVLITLLAVALRIPYLDQGIWFDEIKTLVKFVRYTGVEIWLAPFQLNNHMLYSLCARASVVLFGESTWAIRLPATVFGSATVPALYYLCRQLDRRDLAILASLFLAVSYHHILYSQNARGYTGMALGAVVASIFLIKILHDEKNSRWLWTAYVFSAAFTASIQVLGSLVIISHGLLCLFAFRNEIRKKNWKRLFYPSSLFLGSALCTLLFLAPSLSFTQETFREVTALNSSMEMTAAADHGLFPRSLAGKFLEINQALPGGLLTAYILFLVALTGVWETVKKGWTDAALLLLPFALTVAVVFLVSAYWLPRFLFANAAFLVIVGCRGGFELGHFLVPTMDRRVWFVTGCLIATTLLAAAPYAWKPKQDTAGLHRWLIEESRPEDIRACLPVMKRTVDTYLGYDCTVIRTAAQLSDLERPGSRTVFLVNHLANQFSENHRELPIYMKKHYQKDLSLGATIKGAEIEVYTRTHPPSTSLPADTAQ